MFYLAIKKNMKILHISDLHFCKKFKRENIVKTKKLLKKAFENSFDHLVITGDISDNSNPEDFQLLKSILINFGLYNSEKTTIIIGNHDIFGGVQTAFDIINFPQKCSMINYSEKVELFFNNFKELFDNVRFLDSNSPFPFIKIVNDIVFIGMNTILKYSKLKNPFASNGKIDNLTLFQVSKELTQSIYSGKKKILLTHHHFYKNKEHAHSSNSNNTWNKIESFTLKLRGKKRVFRFMKENNIELVLHGHSHEIRSYNRKGIQFLNAGASVDNFSKDSFAYLINIILNDITFQRVSLINTNNINSTLQLDISNELEVLK